MLFAFLFSPELLGSFCWFIFRRFPAAFLMPFFLVQSFLVAIQRSDWWTGLTLCAEARRSISRRRVFSEMEQSEPPLMYFDVSECSNSSLKTRTLSDLLFANLVHKHE